MTKPFEPSPELSRYVSELMDGRLDPSARQRLFALLRDDPDAQDHYCQLLAVHGLLYMDFAEGCQDLLPPLNVGRSAYATGPAADVVESALGKLTKHGGTTASQTSRWRSQFWMVSGAAALAAAVLVALLLRSNPNVHQAHNQPAAQSQGHKNKTASNTESPKAVAVLAQATGLRWTDAQVPTDVGASLIAGKFELEKGFALLEFFSGASMVIEAPSRFEIVSSKQVIWHLGRVRVHAPEQARGFTVLTASHEVVDLGTEFTVEVHRSGLVEFGVLNGEVEIWDRTKGARPVDTLTTGHGARRTPEGQLADILRPEPQTVGRKQLLEMADAASQERFKSWQQWSDRLRNDSKVILFYGFDEHDPWDRMLRNFGPQRDGSLDGVIVGCQWTTGRWREKLALEFKRTGDRVRVNVPGEFESLTFAGWIRIEGFERWLSALILTDGHDLGEVHWQITDTGQLLLGVKSRVDWSEDYYSPTVLKPSDLGRWVHLACVFNGDGNYVAHYVDGREVSHEKVRIPTTLRIGPAEIGNWVPEQFEDHRLRNLNGRIDELIIFREPLTESQIREIYEAGRPQS